MAGLNEKVDFGKVSSRIPILVERLSEFPEIAAVYLFGSFARGRARKLSDVDIAVLASPESRAQGPPRHPEYIVAAAKALGTDRLDLVILNVAPLPLRHAVFRDGKLLFVGDPRVLARFREESMRLYLDTVPLRREYQMACFRRIRERGFARRSAGR
jgi:predicted nucleotidyltransferase